MIPNIPVLTTSIVEEEHPDRTYKVDTAKDRINGYTADLDSLTQAVYLILATERYKFPIYSWDYGVELMSLIGKPMPYVMSEVPRRIKEALMVDNRVVDVVDFVLEPEGKSLHVSFTVQSNEGGIPIEMEVAV